MAELNDIITHSIISQDIYRVYQQVSLTSNLEGQFKKICQGPLASGIPLRIYFGTVIW